MSTETHAPHEHRFACRLEWTGAAAGPTARYDGYSRALRVDIAGQPSIDMSAAPAFLGDPARHNPEDLLVASLSACHCLTYLSLAARAGLLVVAYSDDASGTMAAVSKSIRFTEVALRPRVILSVPSESLEGPAAAALIDKAQALHDAAHRHCFIASSVNFPVSHQGEILLQAAR